MRYYQLFFILMSVLFCANITIAQTLSRQEKKALEKELNILSKNLERFKEIKEEDQYLSREISQKRIKFGEEFSSLNQKQDSLNQQERRLTTLREKAWQLGNRLSSSPDQSAEVLFRVQIGAYRNQRLAVALSGRGNFFMDDSPQGIKRYMLGTFGSYWEAKGFANELNNSGAQAFVVGYLEGKRIENLKQMPEKFF